jgi:hypothetical protein
MPKNWTSTLMPVSLLLIWLNLRHIVSILVSNITVFSMASVKRYALNDHLLDLFISRLDLEPTLIKSHPNYQSLRSYGTIAA